MRPLQYTISIQYIKGKLEKEGHKIQNITNTFHCLTKEHLSLFFVDLEPNVKNKQTFELNISPSFINKCQLYSRRNMFSSAQKTNPGRFAPNQVWRSTIRTCSKPKTVTTCAFVMADTLLSILEAAPLTKTHFASFTITVKDIHPIYTVFKISTINQQQPMLPLDTFR